MKRIYLTIAVFTFVAGVAAALWFIHHNEPANIESAIRLEENSCCHLSLDARAYESHPRSYFPAGTFLPDEVREKGLANWYSRSLQEMDEPSFQSILNDNVDTYRFLWLRSFHPAVSVRIWKCQQGYCVNAKQLDSVDKYIDGKLVPSAKLAVNSSHPLSADEWSRFLSLLERASFWSLPTVDGGPMAEDGAAWLLEGTNGAKYHVVDRQSPQTGDYREACVYLLKISGLKVDEAKGELY
jgi:hypothetical protein